MAQFNYAEYLEKEPVTQQRDFVQFFGIKPDSEAIVRFAYSSNDEYELRTVHEVQINGKYNRVHCLRTPWEPVDKCPLCKAENRPQTRFFVRLIEYVKDETGNIKAVAKVWDRPASFAKTLTSYLQEYGDLGQVVFKVKRRGSGLDTTYEIMYASPHIYKDEIYVPDFSGFKDFDLDKMIARTKTAEEMMTYITTGAFPQPVEQSAPVMNSSIPTNNIPTGNYSAPVSTTPATVQHVAPAPTATAPVTNVQPTRTYETNPTPQPSVQPQGMQPKRYF